jgi:hypothetical protein
MIYVSEMANGLYLSYDTMLDLGILGNNFPSIGNAWQTTIPVSAPRAERSADTKTNRSTFLPSDEAIRASNCGCSATSQQ